MNDLTLIIPAKNERESLPRVLDELMKLQLNIIIVLEPSDLDTINDLKLGALNLSDIPRLNKRNNSLFVIDYNIPNVNVPLICKHHELLLTSVLKDNTTKERILKEVCEEYGVSGSETIYCKYCGEIIDFHKYSEWEGFGNDNKIINVREIVDNKII